MKKNNYIIILLVLLFTGCSLINKPLQNAAGFTKNLTKKELLDYDKIYEGIYINNIDIKDLYKDEAIDKLKQSINLPESVNLKYNDKIFNINLKDIDYKLNIEDLIDESYDIGRKGTNDERLNIIKDLLKNNKNLNISVNYSKSKLDEYIDKIGKKVKTDVIDDSIGVKNDKPYIIDGNDKIELINEDVYNIFNNIINSKNYDLPIKITKRKILDKKVIDTINGIIGESKTSFSGADNNRVTNLKISSKKINNVIVMPGETFSFNNYVNNIVESEGYKNASTFLNGEVVQGIGGGICQISSTLYQAALKSNMQIIERNQHSLRVGYCTLGLDAMFYEGSSDLKFKNNFSFPILIQSNIVGNNVNIKILGDKTVKNYDVKIYTGKIEKIPMKVEIIYDENLEYDKKIVLQKGHDGYKGKSYIKVGNEKDKVLNTDYYKPRTQIIKIGRKEKPEEVENISNLENSNENPRLYN